MIDSFWLPLLAADVQPLEERQAELPVMDGSVALRLRPRQIQTIELAT